MIQQFIDAPSQHIRIRRVDQDKLVRMQGDPEPVVPDIFPNGFKHRMKMLLPWKFAYRVGGEGDEIRSNPQKEHPLPGIIFKNFPKA